RGIQLLLREVKTDTLVIALKAADNEIKDKIFKNMSKRAGELLKDDLEVKGPVRISEVEAAQKEILMIAKSLADQGKIMMGNKSEEMV
ncbi:MAG TPA: FliG C-terminal domain-containing protein, partial [Candidatus Berkiella sp.]|nr:FliG C-terminal domain-containing protein [Candidatus Berkiella sp.]